MINGYINEVSAKYSPDFGQGLSSHLPMAQAALYELTEDMTAVEMFTDVYTHHTPLELVVESQRNIETLQEALGDMKAYSAYVVFFNSWVEKDGISEVLTKSLDVLSKGLLGRAFHGLIKLAYGVNADNVDEVIRGLAYMASAYLALPEADKVVPLDLVEQTLQDTATNLYFNKKPLSPGLFTDVLGGIFEDSEFEALNFRVDSDGIEQFKVIIDYAVKEYLYTGSFLELHTITSLHAIAVLEPYVEDFTSLMDVYMTAYIGCLLSIKDRTQEVKPDVYKFEEWDVALTYALSTSDAHSIKFLYSCHELYRLTGNELLLKAVGIRLTQDKTL